MSANITRTLVELCFVAHRLLLLIPRNYLSGKKKKLFPTPAASLLAMILTRWLFIEHLLKKNTALHKTSRKRSPLHKSKQKCTQKIHDFLMPGQQCCFVTGVSSRCIQWRTQWIKPSCHKEKSLLFWVQRSVRLSLKCKDIKCYISGCGLAHFFPFRIN